MSLPYAHERHIAELAVQRAAILPQTVLKTLTNHALTKTDKTPVSLADFGAQALIISAIHHNFPNDRIIGEEDAAALRADPDLQERVWELVSKTHLGDEENEKLLGALGSAAEMLDVIDLGSATEAAEGRVWVLDPIDGTIEFIEGRQYAVCLALLVDGEQKVGVLGCPNADPSASNPFGDAAANTSAERPSGVLISATRGQGSTIRNLSNSTLLPLRSLSKNTPNTTALRMADYPKSLSSSIPKHKAIASRFSASWPVPNVDSLQLKWAALALSSTDIFVRIHKKKDKHDWIWDHAGGMLIAEEVGVKVTDVLGREVDFGRGRRFMGNWGWVAAVGELHGEVLEAVGKIAKEEEA
ncbi:MAG: hypothetical protein M1813_004796 [Trichoglossum hirsutum]|nr:MAG: hypothetical protein M1813_004796 [Trichoglossum hirsutum]